MPDAVNTSRPSGDQSFRISEAGCPVARAGSPPVIGTTQMSRLPSQLPQNAMDAPSGENRGKLSNPGGSATGCATPPPMGTLQIPLAYTNTIRSAEMSG